MFSLVRRRLGIPGIISVFALVFAMAGGAYAAKSVIITKLNQISPGVQKQLKGKAGAPGAPGTAGVAGPKGDPGAAGAVGKEGPQGKTGKDGKEGSPWTAGGTLPSEATETGTWAAAFENEGFGSLVGIPFSIPLGAPLDQAHVVKHLKEYNGENEVGIEHETCPGKATNPQAAPGFLCVYTGEAAGAVEIGIIFDPAKDAFEQQGAGSAGAALKLSGTGLLSGTWAVTAP